MVQSCSGFVWVGVTPPQPTPDLRMRLVAGGSVDLDGLRPGNGTDGSATSES